MQEHNMSKSFPAGVVPSREKGIYSIMTRTPLGDVSADKLNTINGVVQEFGLPGVRVTGRQRIQILGVPEDKVQAIVERLGEVGEACKYFVQACPGSTPCRFGIQDSLEMGAMLETFLNTYSLPTKLKSGVSGCSMSCAESYVRDVGMVGTAKGWTVLFGGNAGKGVRKADVLAQGVSPEDGLEIIGRALDFYAENAKKKERTARFVERVGIAAVMEAVNAS